MTETPRNSAKQWESTFSSSTPFTERPFVKTRQKIGAIGDALDIFIRGTGSPKHTWISDVVKSFCIINRPTEATAQVDSARAWLDDRDVRVGRNRVHPKWQTAQELRSELEKLVRRVSGISFGADTTLAIQPVWRARRTQTSVVSQCIFIMIVNWEIGYSAKSSYINFVYLFVQESD
jgi:hypothetical protein